MSLSSLALSAEAVGEEIVTRVATRTKALGAETDLGVKVYRGVRKVDPDMVPCCVVVEGHDAPSHLGVKTGISVKQRYVLIAYVPCAPLNPNTAAHAALRDLKRAIFSSGGAPDWRLGGKVHKVIYQGRDIGARSDGLAFVVAAIQFDAEFGEDLATP
jgi:hypothetical protein